MTDDRLNDFFAELKAHKNFSPQSKARIFVEESEKLTKEIEIFLRSDKWDTPNEIHQAPFDIYDPNQECFQATCLSVKIPSSKRWRWFGFHPDILLSNSNGPVWARYQIYPMNTYDQEVYIGLTGEPSSLDWVWMGKDPRNVRSQSAWQIALLAEQMKEWLLDG